MVKKKNLKTPYDLILNTLKWTYNALHNICNFFKYK